MRRPHQPAGGDGERRFTFGMELIMDLGGCSPGIIRDPDALRAYTGELVSLLGMRAYGEPLLHHFGHASELTTGYTVVQLIETSSIIVHVSEGLDTVYANVFSCRAFDAERALTYSETFFRGTDTTYSVVYR